MNLPKLHGKIAEEGKKRKYLADAMGITVQALGKKLSGKSKITVSDAEKFCTLLNISSDREKCEIFLD